jgi:DNA-binding IclR family transcriptional regulator
VSVNGPYGRYAAVRGTQSDVLRHLRRGDWTTGVPALAAAVGRPERNVWMALAVLAERGLVKTARSGDQLRVWITRAGRSIRL